LGLTALEEAIVFDNPVGTLGRAKEVSRAVDESDWKVKILQHALFCEQMSVQVTEVKHLLLEDYVLNTVALNHDGIVVCAGRDHLI